MKPIRDMSLGELAAFIAEQLRRNGIDAVLTGGGCVSLYTENRYLSYDLDFVAGFTRRRSLAAVLEPLGFVEKNRYFIHPDTPFLIEFPGGPLAVGGEPVRDVHEIRYATGCLRLLSPTDCVKDRLAAWYHWHDRQCLEQALMVAEKHSIDLNEIERWSIQEGKSEDFAKIRAFFVDKSSGD